MPRSCLTRELGECQDLFSGCAVALRQLSAVLGREICNTQFMRIHVDEAGWAKQIFHRNRDLEVDSDSVAHPAPWDLPTYASWI